MRHLNKFVLLLLVVSCGSVFAFPASSVFPSWLVGEWQGQVGDGMYYESWMQSGEFQLIGTAYLEKNGQKMSTETLRLEQIGTHVIYIAAVENNAPVLFTLKPPVVENQWVFENPKHDFPQRIIYTQKSPTSLVARVEGLQDGKIVSEEFILAKK